jgi:hypothetical protein
MSPVASRPKRKLPESVSRLLHDPRFWEYVRRDQPWVTNAPACPLCGAALDYWATYLECCWCKLEVRIRPSEGGA